MAIKYTKRQKNRRNLPTSFFADTPKFTQNWHFWFENIPSGKSDGNQDFGLLADTLLSGSNQYALNISRLH
jgi:hypothetical protein